MFNLLIGLFLGVAIGVAYSGYIINKYMEKNKESEEDED